MRRVAAAVGIICSPYYRVSRSLQPPVIRTQVSRFLNSAAVSRWMRTTPGLLQPSSLLTQRSSAATATSKELKGSLLWRRRRITPRKSASHQPTQGWLFDENDRDASATTTPRRVGYRCDSATAFPTMDDFPALMKHPANRIARSNPIEHVTLDARTRLVVEGRAGCEPCPVEHLGRSVGRRRGNDFGLDG